MISTQRFSIHIQRLFIKSFFLFQQKRLSIFQSIQNKGISSVLSPMHSLCRVKMKSSMFTSHGFAHQLNGLTSFSLLLRMKYQHVKRINITIPPAIME